MQMALRELTETPLLFCAPKVDSRTQNLITFLTK